MAVGQLFSLGSDGQVRHWLAQSSHAAVHGQKGLNQPVRELMIRQMGSHALDPEPPTSLHISKKEKKRRKRAEECKELILTNVALAGFGVRQVGNRNFTRHIHDFTITI